MNGWMCGYLFVSLYVYLYLCTDMLRAMMVKMDLSALHSAASDLGMPELVEGLPAAAEGASSASASAVQSWDDDMLRRLHRLLFEVAVVEGSLVCPESGRRFPVKDGIPNMLLHEDEV